MCRYRPQFWTAEINIVMFIQRLDGGSGKRGSRDLVFPPVTITSRARDCGGSFLSTRRERAVLNNFPSWITLRTTSAPSFCVAPCCEIGATYSYGRTDKIKRRRHRSTYCLTLPSVLHREDSLIMTSICFSSTETQQLTKNMHVHETIRH